jgi:hypothetical protein
MDSFYRTIEAAIADITEHGFDSAARIDRWITQIEQAALQSALPDHAVQETVSRAMHGIYARMADGGGYTKIHKGISRFTINQLKPKLRAELDRRIMASAELIKLNRKQMIAQTVQRLSGWATSIPPGGSRAVDKSEVKASLKKSFSALPYEERRVLIDQSHKLVSELNNIIAVDGGAIAGIWHSHFRQAGYNYRPDHRARDGKTYAIRNSWAMRAGLMNKGDGYTDEMTKPGEEVFCFPGDSKVPYAGFVEKAYRRWYDGELTEIITDSGKALRATPNHPVLTQFGWKAIGSLDVGDQVIEIANELIDGFEEDQDNSVATIAEIFGSLQERGINQTLDLRPADFHGDGAHGDVDVVLTAWPLFVDAVSAKPKSVGKFFLAKANSLRSGLGALHKGFGRLALSAKRRVSRFNESFPTVFAFALHANPIGFGAVSHLNSGGSKSALNDPARGIHPGGDGEAAFSGEVCVNHVTDDDIGSGYRFWDWLANVEIEGVKSAVKRLHFPAEQLGDLTDSLPFATQASKVIEVKRSRFSGHVYNLQTEDGWYVSNVILAHNCRCSYSYVYNLRDLPGDMLTIKGEKALASAQT